ncbi:MAG: acyltransferase [Bacteroides sp.]|nr:acyltransferase [Bacteroides sp.]
MIRRIYSKLFGKAASQDIITQLRERGVTIGSNVDIIDSYIDGCHGRLISIGDNVTITGARILAHDASTKKFLGYTKIGFVKIGSNVFIGNGAIVLPGTTVGNNVIIGAGAIIASDVPDNSVMIGNPARKLCSCDEYIERNRQRLNSADAYVSEILFCERTEEQWAALKNDLSVKKYGFDV